MYEHPYRREFVFYSCLFESFHIFRTQHSCLIRFMVSLSILIVVNSSDQRSTVHMFMNDFFVMLGAWVTYMFN